MNALEHIPRPINEPIKTYAPGSAEKAEVKSALARMRGEEIEIPLIIGGREVKTGNFGECRIPHDHKHRLARYHKAGRQEMRMAIDAALAAWRTWSTMSWEERASISLKAAELISKKYRAEINAATMLGQSKTVFQAEIDAVCELCDFLRFNTYHMQQIFQVQPENFAATWNRLEYRPLEGFVFAISPFNFTAIGGNLNMAPAVMGNVCVWKPSSTAVYSSFVVMRILREAGLPDGVINFVPGDSSEIGDYALKDPNLAGLHFTGSTAAFNRIWKTIGEDVGQYRTYPHIVGETGGKDFVVAHPSAELTGLATCLIRGAFEYQGQKCSATSRAYIATSLWKPLLEEMKTQLSRVKVGPVEDFTNFMGAVIDQASFENIRSYIEYARTSPEAEIVHGGGCDNSKGYFVEPTIVLTANPRFKLMAEEIFGPVLTVYCYEDRDFTRALELCDTTSPYALTGSIFARDRWAVNQALEALRHATGNFYINDKTTGATVGHQPFGGARASGTNDKGGSIYNLLRWISVRTIKECFNTPTDIGYPFLSEK